MKLEFTFYPRTQESSFLIDEICPETLFQNPLRAPTKAVINKRKQCFASTISDLVMAYFHTLDGYCFRPLEDGKFTNERFGSKVFRKVKDTLEEEMLCTTEPGTWSPTQPFATRLYISPSVIAFAEKLGITKESSHEHFGFHEVIQPIRAKHPKLQLGKGKVSEAKPVTNEELVKCNNYQPLANQVLWINKYLLENHFLEGCVFTGFFRSFSEFNNKSKVHGGIREPLSSGGRLYSHAGSYQSLSQEKRLKLKIDGEPVTEIDIKASHLSLAIFTIMGMNGCVESDYPEYRFNVSKIDLYDIEEIPRPLVKQCAVQLVSKGFKSSQWGKNYKEFVAKEYNLDLSNFKFGDVKKAIYRRHPILNTPTAHDIDWGFLQRRESDALIATVTRLAHEYSIPAYPVHDSLIVKQSDSELAEQVLSDCFFSHIGFRPHLERKTDRD